MDVQVLAPFVPDKGKLALMSYPVLLRKLDSNGAYHYGFVVTHLNLDEWCQMRGYRIVVIYPGTRTARDGERTTIALRP